MALQKLLSQLRHKGLGSSSAILGVNTCGVWTSLQKSTLLLPWMQHTQDYRTLPSYAPNMNRTPELEKYGSYLSGGLKNPVLRIPPISPLERIALDREDMMHEASQGIFGSHVGLVFHKDGEVLEAFTGTVIRSDGIIATSTEGLKPLKGTKFKIDVKLLHAGVTCKGVLLHADFHSNIAFVKIRYDGPLQEATFGKLYSLRKGNTVVVAGCNPLDCSWECAHAAYALGCLSSIDREMENADPHIVTTSGKLIKAECIIERSWIGGALLSMDGGVVGVIHNGMGSQLKATPIRDVLKYFKHFEKHRKQAKDLERSGNRVNGVSS